MYIKLVDEFIKDNKYKKWYIALCNKAILRQNGVLTRNKIDLVRKSIGYVEKHHILPKCLCTDKSQITDKANLVLLTPREHYIAHLLLWKATDNNLLAYALKIFNNNSKRNIKINSRVFESARIAISEHASTIAIERIKKYGHPRQNITLTKETKEKLSNALKGIPLDDERKTKIKETMKEKYKNNEIIAPNLGRKWDDKYKEKMSESCKKIVKNDEWNKKNSLANMGRVHIANIKTKVRKRPLKLEAEKIVNESNGEWIYLHSSKPIPQE